MMLPEVIIESHIPYVGDTLDGIARVRRLAPEEIDSAAVRTADALVVRTRTACNAALLEGSRVRFVATATIGTDHIDFPYCSEHGIEICSAPGCNAPAVAQYVWSSVLTLLPSLPEGATAGIIGLGHVGSIVARWGRELGFRILACDPPRKMRQKGYDAADPYMEGDTPFATMEEIAREADVITFHTPHTRSGAHPTHHLADSRFFSMLERKPLIINSARGPVFDTAALKQAMAEGKTGPVVMDCWEGEPAIDRELLATAAIATPHIAGYSMQGKRRATAMALSGLLRYLARTFPGLSETALRRLKLIDMPSVNPSGLSLTRQAVVDSYNPMADTDALRAAPERFEALRNHYNLRPETGF